MLPQVESTELLGWLVTEIAELRVNPCCNSASVSGTSNVDVYVPPPPDVPDVQYAPLLHPEPVPNDVLPEVVNSDIVGTRFPVVRSSAEAKL
jgi:hypothetical protein